VLDPVLDELEAAGGTPAVQALVLRAGIALASGDTAAVAPLVERARAVPLDAADRTRIATEVDRAADLLVAANETEETR
jgi:hypothetical protein